jgi:hypothetical protein
MNCTFENLDARIKILVSIVITYEVTSKCTKKKTAVSILDQFKNVFALKYLNKFSWFVNNSVIEIRVKKFMNGQMW